MTPKATSRVAKTDSGGSTVSRSTMPVKFCQRKAVCRDSVPTTWPALLMSRASLLVPPKVPRSIMVPVAPLGVSGVHRKAWAGPDAGREMPTT